MPDALSRLFKIRTLVSASCYRQKQIHWPPLRTHKRNMATWMGPSEVRYKYIEDAERLDFYVPGGYHPVMLGDKFCCERYIIVHKLGFGRSATTWLAEDTEKRRLVALKISTAESANRTQELEILLRLAQATSSLPGKPTIQTLLDSFTISGPNGTHQCLVTHFERLNLYEMKDFPYHRLVHLPVARAIAAQLVLGVQFVHSQEIVHGDLHPGNILLQLPPDMKNMTPAQLHARVGAPLTEPVIREDGAPLDLGVPSEIIIPIWLGIDSDKVTPNDALIRIIDFGEAFNPQDSKQYTAHAPPLLAPPESRFADAGSLDEPIFFSSDIWTLACTIWEIFGRRPPFESFPISLDEVTIEQVEMLGKLPTRWWNEWENRSNWFDEDGTKNVKVHLQQAWGTTHRGWDVRFDDYIQGARKKRGFEVFSAEEEVAFRGMMNLMLVLEPSERATIDEVVACEWMQRWGLPSLA